MTNLRTLPIKVEPLPGEALDSWVDACAYRMRMPSGQLLPSLGLKRHGWQADKDGPRTNWAVKLHPHEADAISAVTGLEPGRVVSMTLAAYDDRALFIDPKSFQVNRRRLWGRNAGSRYCPQCFAETGGRWNLSWRLGWSFACLRHQCLLADACPRCNRIQRMYRFRAERPIHPAQCGYPAVGGTRGTRCETDLRETATVRFDPDHPLLEAQRFLLETIENGQASFGVYASTPIASVQALADVKAIARRALAPASAYGLSHHLPGDLLYLYQKALAEQPVSRGPHTVAASPGFMAPSHAAVAAAGILVAIDVLGRPYVQGAGQALRWLTVDARSRGRVINPTTTADWGRGTSPILDGITLASMQPVLRPSHQLRYRVMDPCPSPPDPGDGRIGALARSTPALLWPYWAMRLAPPGISARFLRAALSVLVLLPGTKVSTAEAAAMLGSATDKADTSRILQVLEDLPQWRQILTALTRLSNHVADHQAPIDYQRRRALDYESLLPDSEWGQICWVTGTPRGTGYKAHIARAYLRQRLSSTPCDTLPAGATGTPSAFRASLAVFPTRLFPELSAQLDGAAQRFLTTMGITGEPVVWQPGLDLIHDLDLPGPNAASITIAELHRLLYEGNSLVKVARSLGTTLDAIRAVLAENPARARRISRKGGQGSLSGPRTWHAAIPEDDLKRLYLQDRLSIRQIAGCYHIQRGAVAELLRKYEIPVVQRQPPAGVTPDWLRREYLDKRRTFSDLAMEVGRSPVALAGWARKWGIPVRPRGNQPSTIAIWPLGVSRPPPPQTWQRSSGRHNPGRVHRCMRRESRRS